MSIREYINVIETNSSSVSEDWFNTGSFEAYKRPAKEQYEIASELGTIETLEGPVKYPEGYFIMTGPKGEQYPISPEKFSNLKDDLGNGICIPKKIIKLAKVADHSGTVDTSWGEKLHYKPNVDVIIRHGPNDYGVVKAYIFQQTYEKV